MTVRTVEELSRLVREDLAWRRKELRVFEAAVRTADGPKKQAILRGAVAAVYAHWEGYVKLASAAYIDFVRLRRLPLQELNVGFVGLVLRGRIQHLAQTGRANDYGEFVDWLLREWGARAHLPGTEKLSTHSNLSADVFREIVLCLGLPYLDDYRAAEKPIINALLDARNKLAHGEWQRMDPAQFEQFSHRIDELLSSFAASIENAAASKAYRRETPQLV